MKQNIKAMSLTSNNAQFREVLHQVVNDPDYKQVSSVPIISWHQIGLIALAYAGVFGGMAFYLYAHVPLWLVYPMMIFCFYTAFTPLHDATHRAISSNNTLNDILGTISGFLLFPMSNTAGYRFLHLSHHRYVGDEDLDPDEFMVGIPTKYYPFGYLTLFIPDLMWAYWMLFKAWKRTPSQTRLNVLVMIVGNILFHSLWLASPAGYWYLILFFIPNRLGIVYTAYTFAHLPHPEGVKWNEHPFQTTYEITGNKSYMWSFYNQNHHAMHHFLPHIPWYKYHQVWKLANGVFHQHHIPEKAAFSKPEFHFKEKFLAPLADKDKALQARVTTIKQVAKNIKCFTFEPAGSTYFPSFSAGAHIQITLPSGKKRCYSLLNPPFEANKYQIAVKLDSNGNGGSIEMHEAVQTGDILEISSPKNNFVLYENVKRYILISGGIGITPLLSMAHRLESLDQYFELHICAKDLEEVPFQFELENWSFAPNVEIHLDQQGKASLDLQAVLAGPAKDALIYACGPAGFNQWVKAEALSLGWASEQIKQEYFSAPSAETLESQSFELHLHKSQRSLTVQADESIIGALHKQQIKVPYSCLQGTCGTCVCKVVEGEVDHRDAVLSEEDKQAQDKLCLCVSRAKGKKLAIDL